MFPVCGGGTSPEVDAVVVEASRRRLREED